VVPLIEEICACEGMGGKGTGSMLREIGGERRMRFKGEETIACNMPDRFDE